MKERKTEKKKEVQLDFGLKNPTKNIYYKYKDQYELWLSQLETYRFMKDLLMWFVVIMNISLITTQIYTIQTLDRLPSRIPIFNYFSTLSYKLAPSSWIYIYPIMSMSILLIGIVFANRYYHKERELSKALLVSTLLAIFSLCMILLKLVYTL